ncbi:putative ester cyclase [Crossiella equi]|uniref:Ester cyclase n=1 Tax=Crossiella equi TaxID=130796 RepID=A0ABS5AA40_9PSEU|nr:ester cyclase [Crossiella equi]MBP2473443.1 putative ester cyclase [Crossiella equi]
MSSKAADVVHRYLDEVVNGGNLDLLPELWAEDLVWQGGAYGTVVGLAAFQDVLSSRTHLPFTGCYLSVHETITAGEKVIVRFSNSGTHTGTFLGLAPTGRHLEWLGIGIYTVREGKIAEAYVAEDTRMSMGEDETDGVPEVCPEVADLR